MKTNSYDIYLLPWAKANATYKLLRTLAAIGATPHISGFNATQANAAIDVWCLKVIYR